MILFWQPILILPKQARKICKTIIFILLEPKLESAGTLLSVISNIGNIPKNENGNYEIFNLEYSEYIKTEFDFIKHWNVNKANVFAMRTFFGIAIPYGNSNSIPFSKSYYAGGSNDNRAWQPYNLRAWKQFFF